MKRTGTSIVDRVVRCAAVCILGGGLVFQGCAAQIDPDLVVRGGISLGSDLLVFLIENAVRGI